MRGWLLRAGAAGLAAGSLAACAGAPSPPPPTIVKLTLAASADVNPSASGQASPIALRVYQLGSAAGFNNAEFFPLYNDDAAALKTDLIKREDFLLAPGQTRLDTIMPNDQVKAIGILAAYRDFQHTTWRGTVDVVPHQSSAVTATASHDGLTVKPGS